MGCERLDSLNRGWSVVGQTEKSGCSTGRSALPQERTLSAKSVRSEKCQQPTCQSTTQHQAQRIGAASLDLRACCLTTDGSRRWFPRAVGHASARETSRCALPPFRSGRQKARQDLAGSPCRCRWLIRYMPPSITRTVAPACFLGDFLSARNRP